jgi:hypothetical protein
VLPRTELPVHRVEYPPPLYLTARLRNGRAPSTPGSSSRRGASPPVRDSLSVARVAATPVAPCAMTTRRATARPDKRPQHIDGEVVLALRE